MPQTDEEIIAEFDRQFSPGYNYFYKDGKELVKSFLLSTIAKVRYEQSVHAAILAANEEQKHTVEMAKVIIEERKRLIGELRMEQRISNHPSHMDNTDCFTPEECERTNGYNTAVLELNQKLNKLGKE